MVSPINIVEAILFLFSKRALLNASCYLLEFVLRLTDLRRRRDNGAGRRHQSRPGE
jgi:hypothetical protein